MDTGFCLQPAMGIDSFNQYRCRFDTRLVDRIRDTNYGDHVLADTFGDAGVVEHVVVEGSVKPIDVGVLSRLADSYQVYTTAFKYVAPSPTQHMPTREGFFVWT